MFQRWARSVTVVALLCSLFGQLKGGFLFFTSDQASSENAGPVVPTPSKSTDDLPYMCSVRYRGVHRCSATILNPSWLLTSGHCVHASAPKLDTLSIVCGVRMYRTVDTVLLHPAYAIHPTGGNDLALLMLRKALNFTSYVQPIPVPNSVLLPAGTTPNAIIASFGRVQSGAEPVWWNPPIQTTEVQILPWYECQRRLGSAFADYLDTSNICTDNGATVDPGGPVMFATDLQPYNLLAIGSWMVAPCGGPAMHVLVSPHLDWILGAIAPLD
ncbi:trypsin-1-like [Anopheles aquasalis]|uniref:trypsin-1-like n=1 Tax=Anopheles aquasalis TaxID=42839 RepID=UPI00215A1F27|nr:trypsin-1-like [Anopheles aquasalis]